MTRALSFRPGGPRTLVGKSMILRMRNAFANSPSRKKGWDACFEHDGRTYVNPPGCCCAKKHMAHKIRSPSGTGTPRCRRRRRTRSRTGLGPWRSCRRGLPSARTEKIARGVRVPKHHEIHQTISPTRPCQAYGRRQSGACGTGVITGVTDSLRCVSLEGGSQQGGK